VLSIDASSAAYESTWDLDTVPISITGTATLSTHGNRSVTDTFNILFKSKCWDAVLTAPNFVTSTFTFDLWQLHSMPFTAMTANTNGATCGSITYELRLLSDNTVVTLPLSVDTA